MEKQIELDMEEDKNNIAKIPRLIYHTYMHFYQMVLKLGDFDF